ncbi:hypothetical protein NLR27_24860, partial [Escherichia coli]|nr:hypothetical protein [Escherichia coli]
MSAKDPSAATDSAAAHQPPLPSIWPIIGAFGAALVVLGLITYPVVFVFGIVTLLATAIEWMIEAWSERASASKRCTAAARARWAHPGECAVPAAVVVGIGVDSFSRITLALARPARPIPLAVVGALVLAAGAGTASRPRARAQRRHRT